MTDPNQPPGYGAGQPPMTPQEAKARAKADKAYKKASRPFWKKKRVLLPLALVLLIIIIVSTSGGGDSGDNTLAGGDSKGSGCTATYPDSQKKDKCADASGLVTLGGVQVTAKGFARVPNALAEKEICANVSLVNTSDKSKDFNVFDYKLQTPDGEVKSFELTTNSTLSSGVIIKGGKKAGKVCFNDVAAKGQFVFIYKPGAFSSDR